LTGTIHLHLFQNGNYITHLGQRTYDIAEYVSMELSPIYDDNFATIVHGDYKSMNVFLPLTNDNQSLLVDFASSGVEIGVSDVCNAYTTYHPSKRSHRWRMREKVSIHFILMNFHNTLPLL
jgi:Ser/Thr protein kinase RdoA (MazF antagonist)